jgi:4-hydroxybenzoate polyprenyltransferase
MKWERASVVVRICFGFLGAAGVFLGWVLLSNWEIVEKQPSDAKLYLLLGAFGIVLFLWVAIVGRVPDLRGEVNTHDKK